MSFFSHKRKYLNPSNDYVKNLLENYNIPYDKYFIEILGELKGVFVVLSRFIKNPDDKNITNITDCTNTAESIWKIFDPKEGDEIIINKRNIK